MASGVDIWTPKDSIPLITSNSVILTQSFIATAGQTIFVLTDYSYVLGTESIQVFKNGLKLAFNTEWTETGVITITLAAGATVGDIIDVVGYLAEVGGAGGVARIVDTETGADVAWSAAKIITELATKEDADLAIQAHLIDVSNPHSVTQTQVGLSNVDNTSDAVQQAATLLAATKSDVGLSNVDNTSDATQQAATLLAATKSDVDLSNVDNTSDANKPISTATQTALDLKEAANMNIQAHIGAVAGNPHNVTKGDVGLLNVDNTADSDKPVSTAQQSALDLKYDIIAADAKFWQFPDAASPIIANVGTRASKFLHFNAAGDIEYIADSGTTTAANLVSITDAGGYYTGTEVESALQEVGTDKLAIDGSQDMEGDLNITSIQPKLTLYDTLTTDWNWRIQNSGTNFQLHRVSDAGVILDSIFTIDSSRTIHMVNIDTLTLGNELTHKFYVDSVSDERAKNNIRSFTALDKVNLMDVVTYEFNEKAAKPDTTSYGVKAQQLKLICPELVHRHKVTGIPTADQLMYVDRDGLIGILLQSVKELTARIETLEVL